MQYRPDRQRFAPQALELIPIRTSGLQAAYFDMHRMGKARVGGRLSCADYVNHGRIAGDLPAHLNGFVQPAITRGRHHLGRQTCPYHEAVRHRIARCHAEREWIIDPRAARKRAEDRQQRGTGDSGNDASTVRVEICHDVASDDSYSERNRLNSNMFLNTPFSEMPLWYSPHRIARTSPEPWRWPGCR